MAKRGRRRKRLYTPSRYKRTARSLSSKSATLVSSVRDADEDPNDGEDVRNQEISEALDVEAEDDEGSLEDPLTEGLAPSSIPCTELPVSTFSAYSRPDVDAEGVGIATDEATSSNKILFVAPKRPLLSADHHSSVANKKLRMNAANQPAATEQILAAASVGSKVQHQHVQPQSSIAVVNNDVFMLNVSQTSVKAISPISSPPPLGQLFFQRTPVTSVEFPQTHGPVVSFSNEVVPTHFSDEREVQLHIEEDDAVNLSEQYSILDEIEAGNQGTDSVSAETGQPLSVATGVGQTIVGNTATNFSTITTPSIPHSNVINIVHSSGSKPLLLATPDSVAKQQVSVSNSPLLLKPFVQNPPVCETPVMINYSASARPVEPGSLDERTNLLLTTPVLTQPSSSIISFSAAGALQQPLLNAPILVNSPIASQKVITVDASNNPSSSVLVDSNARAISDTVSSPTSANTLLSSDAYVHSTEKSINVTNQEVQFPGFTETENAQETNVRSTDPYVIAAEIPVNMVSRNVQFPELIGCGNSGENPESTRQSSLALDQKVDESLTTAACDQIHVVDAPAGIIRIDQASQSYESSEDQACVSMSSQILSPPQLHQHSSDRENGNSFPLSHQPQSNKYLVSQNSAYAPSDSGSWESNSNFIAEPVEIMSRSSLDNNKPCERMLQSGVSSAPIPLLSNGNEERQRENNASPNCVTAVGASAGGSDSVNDAHGTPNDKSGLGLRDFGDQPKEEEYEDDIDVKSCDEDDSDVQNLTADNEQILSGDAQLKSVASLLNMLHEGNEQQQELLEQHHVDETTDAFGESDYGKAGGVHSKSLRLLKMKLEEGENPEFDLGNLQRRRRIAFTPRQYKLLQTTFEHNNFPEPSEQRSISLQLGAPYRSIKMWFQNKRAAVRKRLGPDAPRAAGSPRTKYKNASDANSCFYCDLCPAAFIALPFLKRHKEYHQIKTFNCPDCNAAFTHPDLLMTHSRAKCRDMDKFGDPCGRSGSSEAKKLRAELRLKLNRSMTQSALDVGVGNLDSGTADTDEGSEIEVVDLCDGQESSMSYQNRDKKSYHRPLNTTVLNVPKLQSLKFLSAPRCDRESSDHGIRFSSKSDGVPGQQALTDVNDRGLVSGLHSFAPESMDENIDGLKILAEQCLVHASNSESSSSMTQPINLHKPRVDHVIDNDTSQVDREKLNLHSRQPGHNSAEEVPHNSFGEKQLESDHEDRNVVEGAKIQARVTMLPISATSGLGGESVPLFARSLPLIAALQQMSRANAEQNRDESATDINSQDQTNGGTEQDSGGEGEQDFAKLQCSSPHVASEEGETSSDNQRTSLVEQMNPDVRNQLLQQAFLNQIKQQQKHEQSQILHKLSKLYASNSASAKDQERETAGRSFDSGGEIISSSPDLTIRRQEPSMLIKNEINLDKDEANQLKFGNLTIYPIKCKTKTEAPQPIDLSSRSGSLETEKEFSNIDAALKTNGDSINEPRQQLLNTFHQNLLKILAGQSSAVGLPQPLSDGGPNSEQAASSLALLPFLAGSLGGLAPSAVLQTLLNANILLNAASSATATAESLAKASGLEQEADDACQANQRAIKERIFSALLSQLINKSAGSADDKTPSNNTKLGVDSDCPGKPSVGGNVSTTTSSGGRPQRRRTTVFSESQHRILYQHFTHCNFPEPAMFRILAKLIGLDAAVIKIWFQNERSRQRKRASFIMEGNKSFADKPYKCMDCDMSFAMATFLVKHSARHSLHDQSQNKTRTCPICSLRFETDAYNEHLRSVHQVDMMLEEVKPLDEKEESENLTCYLCQKTFEDPEALFIHKKDHLTSRYGSVASCSICDSSFVNAICLEAHMQTHYKLDWSYECSMCRSRFPEEILLKSHTMSHGIPAPAISSVNRYRSQTQEGQKKSGSSNSHVSLHGGVDLTASNSSDNSRSNHVDDSTKIATSDDAQRKFFMEALQIGSARHNELSSVGSTSTSGLQVPIQISTSQVTTTQAGTPLAIRTTDAEGRSVIQLLPVQLIPAAPNSENDESLSNLFGNGSANERDLRVNLKPKTKKKIPDLIPISEYQSAAQRLKEQFSLGTNNTSASKEEVKPHVDSILKSYITGALPRSSGTVGCTTVETSNSRPKPQDGFEKPSAFPPHVKIESGLVSPMDSNVGPTGKDLHETYSAQDAEGAGSSAVVSHEGASRTSSHLTSPGSVRVVDSSHLTSQASNNASFTDEHSKLFNLLSQGLNLSKVTNGCPSNECANSEDEMRDETNLGRCAADSDATASDDELVIDLKEGNESQESENEDSKEVAFKIRESAASSLDSGNGKLNAQVLRGFSLESLNGNEEFKKYFLETIQKMMRLREEEMSAENEKDYEPSSPQNDDGCSILGDGTVEYRDSSNVGREGAKPEEHLESKKYRNRREYTQDEQLILLAHFQHNHFPPTRELKLLAKRLNITHRQIMHWFQNRRSKERKSLPYSRRVSRQCSECKATFVHDEGLASHKAVSHDPSSVAVQFGCPVKSCMMSFPSEVLLQTHELLHDRRDSVVRKGFPDLDAMTVKKTRRILPKKLQMEGQGPARALKLPGLSSSSCSPYTSPLSSPPLPSFLSLKTKLPGASMPLPSLDSLALPSLLTNKSIDSPQKSQVETGRQSINPLKFSVGDDLFGMKPLVGLTSTHAPENMSVKLGDGDESQATTALGDLSPVAHIINKLQLKIESEVSSASSPVMKGKTCPRWPLSSKVSPDSTVPSLLTSSSGSMSPPAVPKPSSASGTFGLTSESFSQLQLHFEENNFPSPQELSSLSRQFGLDPQSLSAWYKSRRRAALPKDEVDSTCISSCRSPSLSGGSVVYMGGDSEAEQTCPMCSAGFVTKRDLQQHIRLHSDPAAFTCDVCHAVFRYRSVHASHVEEHATSASADTTLSTSALLAVRSPPASASARARISECKDETLDDEESDGVSRMDALKCNAHQSSSGTSFLKPEDHPDSVASGMKRYSEDIDIFSQGQSANEKDKRLKAHSRKPGYVCPSENLFDKKLGPSKLLSPRSKVKHKTNMAEKLVCRRSSSGSLIISKLSIAANSSNTAGNKRSLSNDDASSIAPEAVSDVHTTPAFRSMGSPTSTTPKFRTVSAFNERSSAQNLNGAWPNDKSPADNERLPVSSTSPTSVCVPSKSELPKPESSNSDGTLKLALKLSVPKPADLPVQSGMGGTAENNAELPDIPTLSVKQLKILEIHYESNNLPRGPELRLISRHTSVPVNQIVRWYSARRQQERHALSNSQHPVSRVQCPHCNSCFISKVNLVPHLQMHISVQDSGDSAENACATCGAHFPDEILLKTHLFCHGVKAYKLYMKRKKSLSAKEQRRNRLSLESPPEQKISFDELVFSNHSLLPQENPDIRASEEGSNVPGSVLQSDLVEDNNQVFALSMDCETPNCVVEATHLKNSEESYPHESHPYHKMTDGSAASVAVRAGPHNHEVDVNNELCDGETDSLKRSSIDDENIRLKENGENNASKGNAVSYSLPVGETKNALQTHASPALMLVPPSYPRLLGICHPVDSTSTTSKNEPLVPNSVSNDILTVTDHDPVPPCCGSSSESLKLTVSASATCNPELLQFGMPSEGNSSLDTSFPERSAVDYAVVDASSLKTSTVENSILKNSSIEKSLSENSYVENSLVGATPLANSTSETSPDTSLGSSPTHTSLQKLTPNTSLYNSAVEMPLLENSTIVNSYVDSAATEISPKNLAVKISPLHNSTHEESPVENSILEKSLKGSPAPSVAPPSCEEPFSDDEGEPLPEGDALDTIITTYTISQYIAEEEKQHQA